MLKLIGGCSHVAGDIDAELLGHLQRLAMDAKRGQVLGAITVTADKAGDLQFHLAGVFADSPAVALSVAHRLTARIEAEVLGNG